MTCRLLALSLLASAALAGCAATAAPPEATPVAPAAAEAPAATPAMSQQEAHDALFALFKKSDEDSLKRNPLSANFAANRDQG